MEPCTLSAVDLSAGIPRREGPRCPICGDEIVDEATLMIRNAHEHAGQGPLSFELHCTRADGEHADRTCNYWINVDRADWLAAVHHVISKAIYTDSERAKILGTFASWLRSMPRVRRVEDEED
jgi:hypothetical protein